MDKEFVDDDYELQRAIDELAGESQHIDALWFHIDKLFSWHDFLMFEVENIECLQRNLNFIDEQARRASSIRDDCKQFFIGLLWVGAISAYEGCMHTLFLKSLMVGELQDKIQSFCKRRIEENRPPHREMKDDSPESIESWLKIRSISDPCVAAKFFEEVYGVVTTYPDSEWCKHILTVRNQFAHRNGSREPVDENQLLMMVEALENLAVQFHEAFVREAGKIIEN